MGINDPRFDTDFQQADRLVSDIMYLRFFPSHQLLLTPAHGIINNNFPGLQLFCEYAKNVVSTISSTEDTIVAVPY